VANTLNLSFEGVERDGLVMALDLAGFSVSSGSACSSGLSEPSRVLMAMGRNPFQATGAIRISLEDELPWDVLETFIGALERAVSRMRAGITRELSR
jgi:cysteine desulfurase